MDRDTIVSARDWNTADVMECVEDLTSSVSKCNDYFEDCENNLTASEFDSVLPQQRKIELLEETLDDQKRVRAPFQPETPPNPIAIEVLS